MTEFEKHLTHRLKGALAYRNNKDKRSALYNRHSAKALLKSIRNERDGTNDQLAETYRRRALGYSENPPRF
jgi:hypothetical protein